MSTEKSNAKCSACIQAEMDIEMLATDLALHQTQLAELEEAYSQLESERNQINRERAVAEQALAEAKSELQSLGVNLVAWILRHFEEDECFEGFCPHSMNSECVQAILERFQKNENAKKAYEREQQRIKKDLDAKRMDDYD